MARAKENANAQGSRNLNLTFMAFKRAEANSPDCPPDKNAMPGKMRVQLAKDTSQLRRPLCQLLAHLLAGCQSISLDTVVRQQTPRIPFLVAAGQSRKHHIRFQNYTFQDNPLCVSWLKTVRRTFSVTSLHRSMVCSPSISTSGSTTGTSPAS